MRLADAAQRRPRWVIEGITGDFRLLDVWALPVEGGRSDLASFIEAMAAADLGERRFSVAAALVRARLWIGALLGWDDPATVRTIPGARERSLRERLPPELHGSTDALPGVGAMRRGSFSPCFGPTTNVPSRSRTIRCTV